MLAAKASARPSASKCANVVVGVGGAVLFIQVLLQGHPESHNKLQTHEDECSSRSIQSCCKAGVQCWRAKLCQPITLMGALWGAAGEAAFPAWIRQVCRQAREAAKRPPGLYVPLPLLPCAVLEKKKPTRCSSQKRVASLLKLPPGRKSPGKSRPPCRNARGMRLLGKSPGGGSESRVPQVERADMCRMQCQP